METVDRSGDTGEVERRLRDGDEQAVGELFARFRSRLKRMLELRIDRRLQGRVDASDVLQEAFLDASRRFGEYLQGPEMSPYVWLRLLTAQRLAALHRYHLGAKMRSAAQEVSLYRGALPQATSLSLAAQLLGRLTSPTRAAVRAEMQVRLQQALNDMDPIDREIIALRHFEELTNNEVAEILDIGKSAASNRYIRALKRLKTILGYSTEE